MEKSLYKQCLKAAYPGIIEEYYETADDSGKPRIIIIGDMHMIPIMQRNIARFIFQLAGSGIDISTIACETDTGYLYTCGFLKNGIDPAKQVEEAIVSRTLKGHEAAVILLNGKIDLLGIEDPELYITAKHFMDSLNSLSAHCRKFRELSLTYSGRDVLSGNSAASASQENDRIKTMSAVLRMMSLEASEEDYTYVLSDKKINTFELFCNYFQSTFQDKGYEKNLLHENNLEKLFKSAVEFYNTVIKRDQHYIETLTSLGTKVYPSVLIFVVGDLHAKKLYLNLRSRCSEILYWHTRPGWSGDLHNLIGQAD